MCYIWSSEVQNLKPMLLNTSESLNWDVKNQDTFYSTLYDCSIALSWLLLWLVLPVYNRLYQRLNDDQIQPFGWVACQHLAEVIPVGACSGRPSFLLQGIHVLMKAGTK